MIVLGKLVEISNITQKDNGVVKITLTKEKANTRFILQSKENNSKKWIKDEADYTESPITLWKIDAGLYRFRIAEIPAENDPFHELKWREYPNAIQVRKIRKELHPGKVKVIL